MQGFTDWDEHFADKHVKFGHFHLSIIKYQVVECCGEVRSNVHDILQSKTYPAPTYYIRNDGVLSLGNKCCYPPKNVHYVNFMTTLGLNRGFLRGAVIIIMKTRKSTLYGTVEG